tara:strand:+ start:880 stop:1524 length:645 start_codon:yes stop_codon:yes gene_type:complete
MPALAQQFINFAIETGVLKFGEFTLKSGRQSPYFFNAGLFNSGDSLSRLGQFYAQTLNDSGVEFDMLYGAAYKGIPLVSTTVVSLATGYGRDVPWAFNRKEVKDHGEGGNLVGAPLQGKVVIVDDVVSAGTSVRESVDIIQAAGATPVAVLVALDRQERGLGDVSALREAQYSFGLKALSIVDLDALLRFLAESQPDSVELQRVEAYRAEYGAG